MDDTSDRSRTSSARQHHHSSNPSDPHSAYGHGQPYNTTLSYQSDYSPDPQARQPSYQPAAYAANAALYNQLPPQSQQPYQGMQTYPGARHQSAAIEVLSTQFSGAPQQYYTGNDSPIAAAAVTPHAQHHPQSQFSSPTYGGQYSPAAQRAPLPYAQTPGLHHQPPHPTSEPAVEEDPRQDLNEAYAQYQDALKRIFINMRDGRLNAAGSSLLTISDWLLGNAANLGLVRDDEKLVGERIKLWNEFNTCWLSVLRKEKEMLKQYIATGHEPQPPEELLQAPFLEQMGREIVRMCDAMEQHGLVDYQMGVWEEEIVDALTECLDLWDVINPSTQVSASGA